MTTILNIIVSYLQKNVGVAVLERLKQKYILYFIVKSKNISFSPQVWDTPSSFWHIQFSHVACGWLHFK